MVTKPNKNNKIKTKITQATEFLFTANIKKKSLFTFFSDFCISPGGKKR